MKKFISSLLLITLTVFVAQAQTAKRPAAGAKKGAADAKVVDARLQEAIKNSGLDNTIATRFAEARVKPSAALLKALDNKQMDLKVREALNKSMDSLLTTLSAVETVRVENLSAEGKKISDLATKLINDGSVMITTNSRANLDMYVEVTKALSVTQNTLTSQNSSALVLEAVLATLKKADPKLTLDDLLNCRF
jgi:hypothetical protein